MKRRLESMFSNIKCFLGFHDWDKPHKILWGSDYSLWYYCKNLNCNKRKTEDYYSTYNIVIIGNQKYERTPKLIKKYIHIDPDIGRNKNYAPAGN